MIRIRQGPEYEAREIWEACCPSDFWPRSHFHWIAYDGDKPVAFGSLRILENEPHWAYMCAAAVLPGYRGAGLQRRLIRARVNWARRHGLHGLVTYTLWNNYGSLISLLREKFRFYEPGYAWAGRDVHYYVRELKK